MISKIREFIKDHHLINPGETIVIGLSGGPDSVALLHILSSFKKELSLKLIAGHLDHEWRASSQSDMLFCKQFAESLNVPFITARARDIALAKDYKGSQEELGRALRRCFFESLATEHNAQGIALGHHKDDQQETFFIRLIRGASINGLAGIYPKSGLYIRPLLAVYKSEILNYLEEHQLSYVEDITNQDDRFLRNKIRLNVIPALKNADERFDKNFEKTLENIQETILFLDKLVSDTFNRISFIKENTIFVDKTALLAQDTYLYDHLLLAWLCTMKVPFTPSTAFFNEMIRFIKQPGSSEHRFYEKWVLKKQKDLLSIRVL